MKEELCQGRMIVPRTILKARQHFREVSKNRTTVHRFFFCYLYLCKRIGGIEEPNNFF
jgi:hypothetical protein